MSLFSSPRERRFWLWAFLAAATIYATLPLTRPLTGFLRARNLLENSFILGFALIVAAIVWQALKLRPTPREIWVALGIAGVYFMAWSRIEAIEERTHLFEYGLVAVLLFQALSERLRQGRRVFSPALLAIILAALLGWLDEGIQALLPGRFYDLRDVGFNALAALMAVIASLALRWARRQVSRRTESGASPPKGHA